MSNESCRNCGLVYDLHITRECPVCETKSKYTAGMVGSINS